MKIRVAVADDNPKMLQALVAALPPELEVVATATDGRSALEQIRALQPSVAVLDLNMPELNGIEIIREIKHQRLACEVVICSVESDSDIIGAGLDAGALGYVLKPAMNRDLGTAVQCVARGQFFTSGESALAAQRNGKPNMIMAG